MTSACVPINSLDGTGTCVDFGTGLCRSCPDGTLCDTVTGRCVCSPLSCSGGCCIVNEIVDGIPEARQLSPLDDQCIPNGYGQPVASLNPDYDGSFVCGTGGSFCTVCSAGTLFSGCCDSDRRLPRRHEQQRVWQ